MDKTKLKKKASKKAESKKKPLKTKAKSPKVLIGVVDDENDKADKVDSSKVTDSLGRDISAVAKRVAKDKALILRELEKTFGIVTNAIAKAKISNTTFYKWFKEDEDFARAVEDIQAGFDVIVEDKLKQKIIQNDGHSIRFYLSHRVKKYKPKVGLGFDEDAKPIKMIITEYDPNYPDNDNDDL